MFGTNRSTDTDVRALGAHVISFSNAGPTDRVFPDDDAARTVQLPRRPNVLISVTHGPAFPAVAYEFCSCWIRGNPCLELALVFAWGVKAQKG